MILILALLYITGYVIYALVIAALVVIYVSFVLLVFVLTFIAICIRKLFRSEWPRNPRRPEAVTKKMKVPQARYSNRR